MICIAMQGHDYDDDFYEIIRKFFPVEKIRFVDSPEDAPEDAISFFSTYQDPTVETRILFPGNVQVFSEVKSLTPEQRGDEDLLRYEIIKSLLLGINSLEL